VVKLPVSAFSFQISLNINLDGILHWAVTVSFNTTANLSSVVLKWTLNFFTKMQLEKNCEAHTWKSIPYLQFGHFERGFGLLHSLTVFGKCCAKGPNNLVDAFLSTHTRMSNLLYLQIIFLWTVPCRYMIIECLWHIAGKPCFDVLVWAPVAIWCLDED